MTPQPLSLAMPKYAFFGYVALTWVAAFLSMFFSMASVTGDTYVSVYTGGFCFAMGVMPLLAKTLKNQWVRRTFGRPSKRI